MSKVHPGLLLLLAIGCSSNEPPADAALPVDAAVDAAAIDARDRCEVLCDCMEARCNSDRDACMATCPGLITSVRECRITHCGYAASNPSDHCPHARGESSQFPDCMQP